MRRQVIVVVHGVGVREAGVATGQLSAVLTGEDEQAEGDFPAWRPHSTDDFLLPEDGDHDEGGLMRVFPAHLRRFRRQVGQGQEERIIADFYWGDISGTGSGLVRVLTGLVRIILGLAHAIRENALDTCPGGSGRCRFWRGVARASALAIHGPVAALNFVLLAGVALTLLWHTLNGRARSPVPLPELYPLWTEAILGLGAVALGLAIRRGGKVFLLRYLAGWLVAVGCVVLAIDLAQALWPGAMARLMTGVNAVVFASPIIDPGPDFEQVAHNFAVPAAVLMGLMVLCWGFSLVCAMVLLVRSWFGPEESAASFVPQAAALMSVLWMLLMTVGWALLLLINWAVAKAVGLTLPLGLKPEMVLAGLRLVTPAVAAFLALVVVGLALHFQKAWALGTKRFRPDDYLPQREVLAERHRLIVGRRLLRVLDAFLVIMAIFVALTVLPDCNLGWLGTCRDLRMANDAAMPYLVLGTGIVALGVALVGRGGLAAGVAIFADVLVYLNDYSWDSRETGQLPQGKAGYWLRGRIHARMRRLMQRLIEDERPEEIVIVSHSQGTVIALDVIAAQAEDWRRRLGPGLRLSLVTMGSPYGHLYRHYFPGAFRAVQDRPALAPGGAMASWINIFRVDDFVGTHIDATSRMTGTGTGQGWPDEYAVPPNGHTNYWVDRSVSAILCRALRFAPSE